MCADVNDNVLLEAVETENIDEVRYLLEQGVDVNARDKDGKTALSLAKNKLLYNYHKYQEIIQLLKDAGATQ